jgi:hypothetical protein
VRLFAERTADEYEQLLLAAGLVPNLLLDLDARAMATIDLVRARTHPGLAGLVSQGGLLDQVTQMMRRCGIGAMQQMIRDRSFTDRGWEALPAISLGFAFLARMSARNNQSCQRLINRRLSDYGALAQAAPAYVAQDLLLAEATLIGAGR